MPERDYTPLTTALLEQLAAEITAHGQSIRSVAGLMGMDYNTFRRHVTGEREMPVDELMRALSVLHLDSTVFVARARDRMRGGPEA